MNTMLAKILSICVWCITGLCASASQTSIRPIKTIICGNLGNQLQSDTITLEIHRPFSNSLNSLQVEDTYTDIATNGEFKFVLDDIDSIVYITLKTTAKIQKKFGGIVPSPVISEYMLHAGDSINIRSNGSGNIWFSGSGYEQMQVRNELERLTELEELHLPLPPYTDRVARQLQAIERADRLLDFQLRKLETYRDILNDRDYYTLKADIIGKNRFPFYYSRVTSKFGKNDSTLHDTLLKEYQSKHLYSKPDTSIREMWAHSPFYVNYLYYKTLADDSFKSLSGMVDSPNDSEGSAYQIDLFEHAYSGALRDKLLILWMNRQLTFSRLSEQHLQRLSGLVKSPFCQQLVLAAKETFGQGQPVVDFTFRDSLDHPVKISDFKGKVIFIDMWFTGCGACKSVAKAIPEVEKVFDGNPDVVFLSVSIDKDREAWKASIRKEEVRSKRFPHAGSYYAGEGTVYLNTGGSGSDNDFIKKYVPGNAYPRLLMVDKEQKIYSSNPPRPDTSAEKLIALMQDALIEK